MVLFSKVKEIRKIKWFSLDFNLLTILFDFHFIIMQYYIFKLLICFFWFLCIL